MALSLNGDFFELEPTAHRLPAVQEVQAFDRLAFDSGKI